MKRQAGSGSSVASARRCGSSLSGQRSNAPSTIGQERLVVMRRERCIPAGLHSPGTPESSRARAGGGADRGAFPSSAYCNRSEWDA
jgi:hypothetical protein